VKAANQGLKADVVLEGGGVKGIVLVGALVALTEAGYQLNRISGTSAGAIVGSLVAAGLTGDRLRSVTRPRRLSCRRGTGRHTSTASARG
jgi:NTE family protein